MSTNKRPNKHPIPSDTQMAEDAKAKAEESTAIEPFAKDNADTVNKRLKEIQKTSGQTTQKVNIEAYREFWYSMFSELGEVEPLGYEEKVAAENEKRRKKPDPEHIYGDQLLNNTAAVLCRLGGDDWGQHGTVVFFVQAAYRDQKNHWKTLATMVTTPGTKKANFREYVGKEIYQRTFRTPFQTFLDVSFPAVNENTESGPAITFDHNGYPQLPDIDVKSTTPKLSFAFQHSQKSESIRPADWSKTPTPWKALSSIGYTKIFDCAEQAKYLTSLDLEDLDVGRLYRNIMLCQTGGTSSFVLNQSLTCEILDDLAGDVHTSGGGTLESPDPSSTRRKENKGRSIAAALPGKEFTKLVATRQQPVNPKLPLTPKFPPGMIDMHDVDKSASGEATSPASGQVSPSPIGSFDSDKWQGIDDSTGSLSPIDFHFNLQGIDEPMKSLTPINCSDGHTSPSSSPPHADRAVTTQHLNKRKATGEGVRLQKRHKRS
ncbi:hypothetical protein EST38_g13637 [Candolleomyces aberdarensis]|uniref:Uncharacterized protein n=1 Tax=Candolleomyces aberdarensis TaxID=2316362 RepID=A0A4Q2CZF9_9AGAR|nr:hypothetical protein EST38_g13637 [Candolleomyces aberdarensis]